MKNGGLLSPHKDSLNKVLVLLFYFEPEDNTNRSNNLGTSFHSINPKYNFFSNVSYENAYLSFSSIQKTSTIDFKSNRCAGFIKSNKSWHSIGPISGIGDNTRKSFILNFYKSEKLSQKTSRFEKSLHKLGYYQDKLVSKFID